MNVSKRVRGRNLMKTAFSGVNEKNQVINLFTRHFFIQNVFPLQEFFKGYFKTVYNDTFFRVH